MVPWVDLRSVITYHAQICLRVLQVSMEIILDLNLGARHDIIQLMHSFEFGMTNVDVNRKRMHQLFYYMTLFLFFLVLFFYKFTKSHVPRTLSLGRLFQQYIHVLLISETLMRQAN